MPDRRQLLGLALGAGAAGMLGWGAVNAWPPRRAAGWLATRVTAPGEARVTILDRAGAVRFERTLPGRGHGLARSPDGRVAVAVGRRPGHFAVVVALDDGRPLATLAPRQGCVFCGHGLFSRDGRLFLASETDWAGERGLIGLYETTGWRRVGEWASGGLDPHDLVLSPDGRRLVVANGGLLTDPDAPGTVLNLDRMESSLVVLDMADGAPLAKAVLPQALHQLSIRHLAGTRDGAVAFAMQYQGPPQDAVPMVGLLAPDGRLTLLDLPASDLRALHQYCGSAAVDPSGTIIAVASPRGGLVALWQAASGRYLGRCDLPDVCGLAGGGAAGCFVAASGQGGLAMIAPGPTAAAFGTAPAAARWDNHMLAL